MINDVELRYSSINEFEREFWIFELYKVWIFELYKV